MHIGKVGVLTEDFSIDLGCLPKFFLPPQHFAHDKTSFRTCEAAFEGMTQLCSGLVISLVSDEDNCAAELLQQFLVRLPIPSRRRHLGSVQRRRYGRIGPRRIQQGPVVLIRVEVQSPNIDLMRHSGRQHSASFQREHFTRAQRPRRSLGREADRKSEEDHSRE